MAKMKTLTVSGQTYTVNDPEAVSFCTKQALTSLQQQIARENIGACTVEQTVDRLCPPFSEADTVVVCQPVEGSALAAVSGILPRQDGTGDPSPDNIRPISGHSSVKLTRCGKNLIDPAVYMKSAGATTLDGDVFTTTITTGGAYVNRYDSAEGVHPAGTYTVSVIPVTEDVSLAIIVYDHATGDTIARKNNISAENGYTLTFTANAPCRVTICGSMATHGGVYGTYSYKLQMEVGKTATAYEPYRGETFDFELGQTVYGGYMDWETGLLIVDRAFKTLTGDGIGIYVEALNPSTRITIQGCTNNGEVQGNVCNHLSSHFKTHHGNHSADIPFWNIGGNKGVSRCWLYCDPAVVGTDTACVNAWLKAQYDAGTPVQVSYKLAEPITVQLTPQEIHALSGENILYSDTGDTTVTGKADPGAIIEKLTNAIIALGGNV